MHVSQHKATAAAEHAVSFPETDRRIFKILEHLERQRSVKRTVLQRERFGSAFDDLNIVEVSDPVLGQRQHLGAWVYADDLPFRSHGQCEFTGKKTVSAADIYQTFARDRRESIKGCLPAVSEVGTLIGSLKDRRRRIIESQHPRPPAAIVPKDGSKTKKAAHWAAFFSDAWDESALTCLEPTLCLVDHVDTALAAHDAAVAVPVLQRAERVANLHGFSPLSRR